MRTRVGHSFIKATMAETDAVFGGEHSGHFYFRDFWRADSGMLAALHVLAALAETGPAAVGAARASTPATSPPARSTPRSPTRPRSLAEIEQAYGGRDGVDVDHLDGLTVDPRRLVVQCPRVQHRAAAAAQRRGPATQATMDRLRDDVLATIRRDDR